MLTRKRKIAITSLGMTKVDREKGRYKENGKDHYYL